MMVDTFVASSVASFEASSASLVVGHKQLLDMAFVVASSASLVVVHMQLPDMAFVGASLGVGHMVAGHKALVVEHMVAEHMAFALALGVGHMVAEHKAFVASSASSVVDKRLLGMAFVAFPLALA